ncbi:hypothetical protein [uncultured Xylophilus sp.]|uniref:hypothetical protein n=1 Tax=uncultured Xylophilus sp. TaxID=296832 RepID=UPI0025D5AACF|nr:hypothetical protein [uncultured Xylophilus sp.]
MQYVFTMTSRMVAIAGACAVLLCILLFLLGVEIGKTVAAPSLPAGLGVPSVPSIPSLPGAAAPAAAPAGSVSPAAAPATAPAPSTARP